jgi:ABC-type Zn uptake system ZnuABC Zn-binding protein ZnuA
VRALVSLLVLGCIAPALASCGGEADSDAGGARADLTAVATTSQVADLVGNVGGARVDVEGILPAGGDPHAFEPQPSDAASLTDAAVVFKSGGDLDGWLDELLDNAGADADVVSLIDHVHTIQGDKEDAGEEIDPHWWQDPRNAMLAVAAVRDALIKADPEGRAAYRRNAAAYSQRLRRLDSEIAACMAKVPTGQRKLVTTHDALGYFANRYGVEVVGALIPSRSTQAQPSVKDINALVDQIRDEGVEAIFPETAVNDKLEQAVSREAHAEVGKPLWADSLGREGSTGDTYLKAMAFNTEVMVDGMTAGEVACRPKA